MSRLLVLREAYPELKANQNFLALQDQLEQKEYSAYPKKSKFNLFSQTIIFPFLFSQKKMKLFGNKEMRKRLPIGTKVKFNIAQGLDVGTATIADSCIEIEDGEQYLYYKLDSIVGSSANIHRNKDRELWINAFEVRPIIE